MKKIKFLAAGLILLAQPAVSQTVKLANVALGMNEAEVKTALAKSPLTYVSQPSEVADLNYLVAESEEESFAFMFIDGRVAAFALSHILPPGQQPFLPQGQEPTVAGAAKPHYQADLVAD